MCEHVFPMTSQGHRYAQFQRALKTGNAHLALAAAAAIEQPEDLGIDRGSDWMDDLLNMMLLARKGAR